MKSQDLQNVVISKYKNGDGPTKIFRDLSGTLSLPTIKRWCKMIAKDGTIKLSKPPGRPRTARTKATIQKIKNRLKRKKKPISTRKLANELDISQPSVYRVLKDDLQLRSYKKVVQPLLSDDHKEKRVKFANWIRNNYRKADTMRILFSDEKIFDIDGIYNSQNDRIWASNRVEADSIGGIKQRRKFPERVMVWLGVCSKGVSPLVIFENGTVNHERYIEEVLSVAKKYGNKVFGENWIFQQDGARAHTHRLTQQWCQDNFPDFIPKERWPPNSPDLNPLDFSIWEEFNHAIDWSRVSSKKTLIGELKRAVKRIRFEIVLESCNSFSIRLNHVCENGGNYYSK